MSKDLEKLLADLFYHHEQVILPGIGAFSRERQAAVTDPVQERILPPTRQLRFNANLVLDDGVLQQAVQDHYNYSADEARELIARFTEDIRQRLDRRELVEIEGLGRLYRNYESKLQFLPENRNYDLASFGLPVIEAAPVDRRSMAPAPADPPPVPAPAVAPARDYSDLTAGLATWLQRNLVWIALLTAFVVSIGWYLLSRPDSGDDLSGIPSDRLNVSPLEPEAPEEEAALPDPEPTVPPAPVTQRTVIAVGLFGNTDNAERMIRRLYDAGFEPYTRREGNLTRVGAQVSYTTASELDSLLQDIRRRFERTAFVMNVEPGSVN